MKVALVVGTRPEIVKMAPIIRACLARRLEFTLIHTGQHYSFELDGVFFMELVLPRPTHNLVVGSGSRSYQISTIMTRLEEVLTTEAPDIVLVEGDTNSVLAAALTANSMHIPVGHVEAGLRSHDRTMPEEINRTIVDHIADHLFAPTELARRNLLAEGIPADRIEVTGNTVVDELVRQRPRVPYQALVERFGAGEGPFAVATVHRAENTDDPVRLQGILDGLSAVASATDLRVLLSLHPRTSRRIDRFGLTLGPGIEGLPPLGYIEFLGLHDRASLVLTDSGGLQEEACALRVPCVTLRDSTERPESIDVGASVLAGAEQDRIVRSALDMLSRPRTWPNPFGDGRAGERTIAAVERAIGEEERATPLSAASLLG
jgi:UDP-N-acetylglucosamine 2-epimerase (non-hydrolysing)